MLVLNMNSKRQRRPNVRLWEVGDLPAAFTCGVSQRIKQRRWKDDSIRNNELENNGNSGFPQQFPHEFGFLEFGIPAEVPADNSENKNPNSLKLVPEISGQDEISGSKAELCFGSITRKSRLMKRRRRTPDSLFFDPWGSKVHLARTVGDDFTLKCGFDESSGRETTWTNEDACAMAMETAEPNSSVQMVLSSNEHCDEAEIAFPLSTGEGDKGETREEYTINGVGEWLEEIGFGKYAELFEMHEVDEETLPLLTLDDLKEMGIFAVGVRRKLLNAIKRTKGRQFQISA